MTEQELEFTHLVEVWTRIRGTGKGYEEGFRTNVSAVVTRTAELDTSTEKPAHWGPLALPGGIPITWEQFRAINIHPHLVRLRALLACVEQGRPFPDPLPQTETGSASPPHEPRHE